MQAVIDVVEHEDAITQSKRLLWTSQRLCGEAGYLAEATRTLRAVSFAIRRAIRVPSIRGGAGEGAIDGSEAETPRYSPKFPLVGLPETRQRQCPSCLREDIASMNTLWAIDGLVKQKFSCPACRIAFWVVRPEDSGRVIS